MDTVPIKSFMEYMGNRTRRTTVNGHTSEKARVTCGTAQGSILGPLLLIIYLNDNFNSVETDGNICKRYSDIYSV